MAPFFDQPGGTDDNQAAGFCGPDFWQDKIPMDVRLSCRDSTNSWLETSAVEGGLYQGYRDLVKLTDVWPIAAPASTASQTRKERR